MIYIYFISSSFRNYLNCASRRSFRISSDWFSLISCPVAAPGFDGTVAGNTLDNVVVAEAEVDIEELLARASVVADTGLVEVDEVDILEERKNLDSNSALVSSRSWGWFWRRRSNSAWVTEATGNVMSCTSSQMEEPGPVDTGSRSLNSTGNCVLWNDLKCLFQACFLLNVRSQ